ncbi:hypothetical protein ABGT92_23670 [Streptomyces cinereoruber]|uniref:hypothetical protein n=1 Tax=Streptomyces cinereoruber TaxID=67260 RepID=UPI00345D94D6
MTTSAHPHRVRYRLGVTIHAVRVLAGLVPTRETACEFILSDPRNHDLPADEPVTCPACKRNLAKENR